MQADTVKPAPEPGDATAGVTPGAAPVGAGGGGAAPGPGPQPATTSTGFVTAGGRRLEVRTIGELRPDAPALVFLHEGLGCSALWRDFPERLAALAGLPALVYSRLGYGQSDPFDAPLAPGFMHYEARVPLPELLEHFSIRHPVLVGHSDGASIALIYAGEHPDRVEAVVALAPHLFVEPVTIASIADIAARFPASDLPRRMAKYHRDAVATFQRWTQAWLDPAFRDWNIEADVAKLRCPVLAVQGFQDEYGTMLQVRRIAELAPRARWVGIEACGHSPFIDQPDRVLAEVGGFLSSLGIGRGGSRAPNAAPAR